MYQLDEKLMADNRAIIAIAANKNAIDPKLKPAMHVFDDTTKDTYVVSSMQNYHRLLQEDAYTGKVHYDLTFAGNITVEKDLIVKGNVTNLETQDLIVKDNIIELNKDETGDGISKTSSGIEINRGTKERARILYSEQTDRVDISGFLLNLHDRSLLWAYEDGDIKTRKDLYTKHIYAENGVDIGGDMNLNGDAFIRGTLTVDKATVLKSTLGVTGATTLYNTLNVTGATTLSSTLTTKGATLLENTLTTKEAVLFEKTLEVRGLTNLRAGLNVTGATALTGTLDTTGAVKFNNTLTVDGATRLNSTLGVAGNTTLESNLRVEGTSTLIGATSVIGILSTTSINNSGNIQTSTINATSNGSVGGTLVVTGESTFHSNVAMDQNLNVTGNTQVDGTLTVNSPATIKELTVKTSTMLEGVLTVKELTTLEKGLVSKANSTFEENLTVNKNLTVLGTTSIAGATDMTSLTLSNNLVVNGTTTLNTLRVNNTSEFIGVVTADLIKPHNIEFRNPTAGSIKWIESGLTHSIFGAAANDPTYGYTLYDKAINDYNVTFKVNQGSSKDKGFVFVSNTTPLLHIAKDSIRSANDVFVKRGSIWSPLLANSDSHKANHSIGGHDFLSPANIGAVKNAKGTPELLTDVEGATPAAGIFGRLFFATDTKRIFQDLGNAWQIIGGQDTMPWESITGKPTEFNPPIASTTVLGGIKIGNNLTIDPDGTLHVPKQTIEYTVHVQEFIATANQKTFKINKSFLVGRNHVSPFLYGRRVPPTAYREIDDSTIEFIQGVPAGAIIEFYVLLIPSDLSFVNKVEEFNVAADQVVFNLSQGRYTVGSNKLKIFLNGAMMPRSSFDETSPSQIRLKECPGVGNHILIEYMYDPIA